MENKYAHVYKDKLTMQTKHMSNQCRVHPISLLPRNPPALLPLSSDGAVWRPCIRSYKTCKGRPYLRPMWVYSEIKADTCNAALQLMLC